MVIFKLLVREHRLKKRLTQKQLAQLSGLSKSYISDIECGQIPSLPALDQIAKALRVRIVDLILDDIDYTEEESTLE